MDKAYYHGRKILPFGFLLYVVSSLIACSESGQKFTSSPKTDAHAIAESFYADDDNLDTRIEDNLAKDFITLRDIFSEHATDDGFEIDGLSFSDVRSSIELLAGELDDLDERFGTLGEYMSHLDIDPYERVTDSQVSELISGMHDLSGRDAFVELMEANDSSEEGESEFATLNLDDKEDGCIFVCPLPSNTEVKPLSCEGGDWLEQAQKMIATAGDTLDPKTCEGRSDSEKDLCLKSQGTLRQAMLNTAFTVQCFKNR